MESFNIGEVTIEQAAVRLMSLHAQIGEDHEGSSPDIPPLRENFRNLTESEWQEVCNCVLKFEFPVNLVSGVYGFYVVIHDYNNNLPIPEKPEELLVIEHCQLPMAAQHPGFNGQPALLKLLEPLTHRPRNQELLDFYGFEPLGDIMSYAY